MNLKQAKQMMKPLNEEAMQKAQEHLDSLTKPPGSLGVLEDIARKIAGITGNALPGLSGKTAILMAGDHGVVEEGIAAFPQEVTPQMVMNFANGGAAMNVLSRHVGADLKVVDVGVASDLPDSTAIIKRKVAYGTKNMAKGAAMTKEQALQAIEVGLSMAEEAVKEGAGLLAAGEMGIGNTTPSSAIVAFYSGLEVEAVTGYGTGLPNDKMPLKSEVIRRAIEVNKPDAADPIDVLSKIGGLEIAAMAGVFLGAAALRVPVIVDGFIAGAAALVAIKIEPKVRDFLLASHLSEEPGHAVTLELLGLEPMLRMKMRLGEGSGAALAMNLVDAAIKIMHEMATFESAGVSSN